LDYGEEISTVRSAKPINIAWQEWYAERDAAGQNDGLYVTPHYYSQQDQERSGSNNN
jgi:hypothetical protein